MRQDDCSSSRGWGPFECREPVPRFSAFLPVSGTLTYKGKPVPNVLIHFTPAQVGTYAYVNPAIAVVIGVLDGEELTFWLVAGVAVILAGVALVRGSGRRKERLPPAPTPDAATVVKARPAVLCRKEVQS